MSDAVARHYGSDGLTERLRSALGLEEGAPIDPDALAGADEFHLGGRAATEAMLADVGSIEGASVIDVGCGIGGAARVMARRGGEVLGVDLTPDFVETARELTAAVGMSDAARFELGSGLELPADEAGADLVTMLHVGMNVEDKAALFGEFARVLREGGTLAVYDIMRIGDGDITYPVPWASSAGESFVEPEATYVEAISQAGFTEVQVTNRRQMVLDGLANAASAPPPPLNLAHLMGPQLPVMFGNLRQLLESAVVAPVQILARR